MLESQSPPPAVEPPRSHWPLAFASFLIGAVVGDLAGGGGFTRHKNPANEISAVLTAQQEAWNRGDLDGFMATYWKSDKLSFCSGEITYGWQPTRDRYARKYFADGKDRGTLTFSELEALYADDIGAALRGRFQLQFHGGKTSSGRFTLVLRKIGGAWKIVHDHTSADPTPSP